MTGTPAEVREAVRAELFDRAEKLYEFKERMFGEEQFREVERVVLLRNVDQKWMDHLEAMDSLMESIGLQAYAQRNPISEYRIQGADLFDEMITEIRDATVRMMLSIVPKPQNVQRVQVIKESGTGPRVGAAPMRRPVGPVAAPGKPAAMMPNRPVVNKGPKVGRNDPCPCGSGKKYKKCCGRDDSAPSGD
ncbi:MAG: SEC-C domain-containing protein [Clostridia bacterium]|nr:SEC-C domain-containing protein [Clostridia bacterium]